ncbi:MAG: hypothetical protein AAF318_13425 [Pseudomonadota bacterium]
MGDIIVAEAGAPVPVDGIVVDGEALVDQHVLTGEARPGEKAAGDEILASTVVLSGRLRI